MLLFRQEARMDDGRIDDDMTLAGIAKQLAAIQSDVTTVRSDIKSLDAKVGSLDTKVGSLDGKVVSLGGKIQSLDGKMTIEFEETKRLINLGFENVQMLDEKVGRRFDATDGAHADHKSLLEAAPVSLRRDIKRPKRTPRRR